MFDTHSDFALNKKEKTAIVCQSLTGEGVHLTREDFASEEEFARWKKWSDDDYHETEFASRKNDSCFSFEGQRDASVPSAEEIVLAPYIASVEAEQRQRLSDSLKAHLTERLYRRMCLYYLDGKSEAEIASMEGVNQSSISRSISSGTKIVERFFKNFSQGSA